ncbi:hypothetical protein UVI_02031710 [Ustilaginoidea virens]|uniref:Uncharacterized protein n=1 Tax=Ustilaginoidea virens TaxID=1159556 RepID=A0A1B5KTY3_USTVR|nr:hypothetical protein UVI_02031710 [Ustilaginoidea virens]
MALRKKSLVATVPSPKPFEAPDEAVPAPAETTLVGSSSPFPPTNMTTINPRLFERAEKLALMTNELKLHKATQQVDEITRDLEQLARRTQFNETFRQQHEERMESLWCEILAVRAHIESASKLRAEERLEMKDYRREVVEVKREMDDMKGLVTGLAGKVKELPTLSEANAVLAAVHTQREACEMAAATATGACAAAKATTGKGKARRSETIKSTRRWHHEHKTTGLPDAAFTAKYLRKQSKRDPHMAILLHRAIQRRVESRRDGRDSQPRSLEEFCQDVSWGDVTQTVEDELVKRVAFAVRSLRQISQ